MELEALLVGLQDLAAGVLVMAVLVELVTRQAHPQAKVIMAARALLRHLSRVAVAAVHLRLEVLTLQTEEMEAPPLFLAFQHPTQVEVVAVRGQGLKDWEVLVGVVMAAHQARYHLPLEPLIQVAVVVAGKILGVQAVQAVQVS